MKRTVIVLSCLGITMASHGQNLTNLKFSNPQLVNPALTGISKTPELNFSSTNMIGTYNQTYLDYSQYSEKLHGGIGIHTNNVFWKSPDKINSSHTNSLGFSYAYQNSINEKWHFSIGTSFNIANTNWTSYMEKGSNIDLGLKVGGLIFTDKFYASMNYNKSHNLNLDYSFLNYSELQTNFGYKIKPFKGLDFIITPSLGLSVHNKYGPDNMSLTINANVEAQYKKLHFGIGTGYGRPQLSLGYDFNRFRLNYSMGNISAIPDSPKSSIHQLTFKLKLKNKSTNSNRTSFNHNLF